MSEQTNSRAARRQKLEAERKRKKGSSPKRFGSILKKVIMAIVIAGLALFVGGVGLFAFYASTAPDLDENLLKDPLTSQLLDKNGDVFVKLGAEKREYVPYDEIPDMMEQAILATEDVRFYKHHGMDFWRLGGAILANLRGGFGSEGASTLTQQVIKNSFLTDEKTLKRKAQEAWLAFKLEREYSKEEIFEMYFNKVLMGRNIYGFGTASQEFFGKDLDELSLEQYALLAGMPQSPNAYYPFRNPERAEKRRNIVLTLMEKHGKISKAEMEAAKATPIASTILPEDERKEMENNKYPAYVDVVLDELEAAGMMDLVAEGVTIQTNLDPKAQEAVEREINSPIYESDEMQAAMTVLDTKTGEIVAVGGGRNFTGRNTNFATRDNPRQPGSVIKPILSYGPIIENKAWSTGQIIVDEPYKYKGTDISIRNVDGGYAGPITIREALYNSRNIPAIKVFEEVGTQKARDFAGKLGLNYKDMVSSEAIGGGSNEFSTIEIAGAYSALGNGGIYTKPHTVKKIILRDGKTEKNMVPDPVTAMKDSTAYMVTDMLRDVMTKGTGKKANVSGLDIAGKTGTTNYSAKTIKERGYKNTYVPDSWFTGYTTNYTISVWGGYSKNEPIKTYDKGRDVPKILFHNVMREISSNKETARFKQPSSVEEAKILKGSNPIVLASPSTPAALTSTELFVRGTVPEEMAEEELTELAAPSDLTAQYDADSNSITLSWNHEDPNEELIDGEVQFNVLVSVDGSEPQNITTTAEHSVTFQGVEIGRTYVFSVTAIANDIESSPASTSLMVEGNTDEDPVDEEENEDDYSDNDHWNNGGDNNGDNNNGNGNGNGNWNNNGNNGNNQNNGDGSGNNGNNNGNWNNNGNNPGSSNDKDDGSDNSGEESSDDTE